MPAQFQMYVYYILAVPIAYLIGVGSVLENDQTIYVVLFTSIPLLVSIGGMFLARTRLERLKAKGMFSLRTQSWAFVLGDAVALPITFAFLIWSHRSLEMNSFFESRGWTLLALLIGVIVGVVFRKIDSPRYIKAGRASALKCPTKIWHDLGVYPILAGLTVWSGTPLLAGGLSGAEYGVLGGLILWVCFGLYDVARPPDISTQHTTWDTSTFRPS